MKSFWNRTGLITASLVLAASAAPSAAQEATSTVSRFVLEIDHTVDQDVYGAWRSAVRQVAKAHEDHDDGLEWATYVEMTGGPDVRLKTFFPFQKMGDLDGWASNRRVVREQLGSDAGQILRELETLGTSSDRILRWVPALSNPPAASTLPRYYWLATDSIAPGKEGRYIALMQQVRDAYLEEHPDVSWMVYTNVIGGEGTDAIIAVGFDRFAELDDWPGDRRTLIDALGQKEAAELKAALSEITETRTSLWRLAPKISRVEE